LWVRVRERGRACGCVRCMRRNNRTDFNSLEGPRLAEKVITWYRRQKQKSWRQIWRRSLRSPSFPLLSLAHKAEIDLCFSLSFFYSYFRPKLPCITYMFTKEIALIRVTNVITLEIHFFLSFFLSFSLHLLYLFSSICCVWSMKNVCGGNFKSFFSTKIKWKSS